MSGGVDSSVVALLMTRHSQTLTSPLNLVPVYMRNWSTLEESNSFEPGSGGAAGCEWQAEYQSVEEVCRKLDLPPPRLIDLTNEYWRDVFEPSLEMWGEGRTPNPDVVCNRLIKFGALLHRVIPDKSSSVTGGKKSWLATGHYARLLVGDADKLQLHRAKDSTKDQTYFLSSVPVEKFSHALFPLADLLKTQVRQLASDAGLPTAARKESMGLCFVGVRGKRQQQRKSSQHDNQSHNCIDTKKPIASFGDWLSSFLSASSPYTKPGPYVTLNGEILGTHAGLHSVTIGQKARLAGQPTRLFVARKEVKDGVGQALVVPGSDHPLLQCTAIKIPLGEFQWINADVSDVEDGHEVPLLAQIRHQTKARSCRVSVKGATLIIRFAEDDGEALPFAVTSGQVVALYDGSRCLGSGVVPVDGEGQGVELRGTDIGREEATSFHAHGRLPSQSH